MEDNGIIKMYDSSLKPEVLVENKPSGTWTTDDLLRRKKKKDRNVALPVSPHGDMCASN